MSSMALTLAPAAETARHSPSATRVAYRVVAALTAAFVVGAAALAVAYLLGMRFYVVVSGSMAPNMPTGSLCVTWEGAAYDHVTTGDIIAFRTETGDITTHRVNAVTSRGLVTKGDANEDVDATPVTRMGYAGRVVWHAAGMGHVVETVLSPVGMCALVVAVIALLVAELALKHAADVDDAAADADTTADAATPEAALVDAAALDAIVSRAATEAVHAALAPYLEGTVPAANSAEELS